MSWRAVPVTDVISDETSGNIKTLQSEYLSEGNFPIVDQGKGLIGGYTNDKARLCRSELPVIVFGDHTKNFKYIDFPFCLGADGTKVLHPKNGADPKYVFHALRQVHIPDAGYSRHFKYLKHAEIPLPLLEEQRRIAGILDQADALRSLRTSALDKLNTLGQSIFHEMFGEGSTLDLGQAKQLGPFLVDVTNGISRRAKSDDAATDIVLRLKDIRDGFIDFSEPNRIALSDKEASKYRLRDGDLLFIRVNGNPDYVGRNAVFEGYRERVFFNDHVMRVRVDESQICPQYLSFVINSPIGKREIRSNLRTSAGQHTINQTGLAAMRLPIPRIEEQHRFRDRLKAIFSQSEVMYSGLAISNALFTSLQHRAFRGEL